MCRNVLCNAHVWSITLPTKNSSTVKQTAPKFGVSCDPIWPELLISELDEG